LIGKIIYNGRTHLQRKEPLSTDGITYWGNGRNDNNGRKYLQRTELFTGGNIYNGRKYSQQTESLSTDGIRITNSGKHVYNGWNCLQRTKIFTTEGTIYRDKVVHNGRKNLQRTKSLSTDGIMYRKTLFTTDENIYNGREKIQRTELFTERILKKTGQLRVAVRNIGTFGVGRVQCPHHLGRKK
jgi:hypothetical protein